MKLKYCYLFFLYCFFVFGCEQNNTTLIPINSISQESIDLFHQALDYESVDKEKEALDLINKSIKIDPNFSMGHLWKSILAQTNSEVDASFEKAESLKENMNDVEKALLGIRSTYRNNNLDKRLEHCLKLAEAIPNNAYAHQRLGITHWEREEIQKSRDALIKAIKIDPNYAPPLSNLTWNYLWGDPQDHDLAMKYAKKALSIEKEKSFYFVLLGDVYRAKNDLEMAAKQYDKAFKAGTNKYLSAGKAGHAYTFLEDYEEARKRFSQAKEEATNPSSKLWADLFSVYTYLYIDDYSKAHADLLGVKNNMSSYGFSDEEKDERMSRVLWNEYHVLSHMGKYDDAKIILAEKRILDMSIANKSKNKESIRQTEANLLWLESHLFIMMGLYDKAEENLAKVLELRSVENNPLKNDGYNNLMAMCKLMRGDVKNSIEHFDKVKDQSNVYFKYFKGLSYKSNGNMEKAQEIFESVAKYNFNGLIYTTVRKRAIKETLKNT